MNWEALGAVGEVLGAIGVMASLLYLASQVRASTRASAVEAKLESTRLLNDFVDRLIESPEINELMIRGREGLEDFSREDYVRYSNLSLKAFWYFSAGHFQFRRGTLAADDWFEIYAVIRYWLRGRGCRDWWERLGRHMFGGEFAAFIQSEIDETVEPSAE